MTVNTGDVPLREAKKEVLRCLNAFLITPLIVGVVDGNVSCRWFFRATAMKSKPDVGAALT